MTRQHRKKVCLPALLGTVTKRSRVGSRTSSMIASRSVWNCSRDCRHWADVARVFFPGQ
jgi:hypothetical protein